MCRHGCGIIIEIDGNSYSVDGYDHSKAIAYQFNCCYFHSHNCAFNEKNIEQKKNFFYKPTKKN